MRTKVQGRLMQAR